jgi:hypothetical protein
MAAALDRINRINRIFLRLIIQYLTTEYTEELLGLINQDMVFLITDNYSSVDESCRPEVSCTQPANS